MPIPNPKLKILSIKKIALLTKKLRKQGLKIVFTNGCFDLIHRGHAEYLMKARTYADFLIVGINSDNSIKKLKGPDRPLCKQEDRAYLLASFYFVDAVVIFNQVRCTKLMKLIKPDIYVKGGDYNINNINQEEKEALLESGTKIKFIPFIGNFSTTFLLNKIKNCK
ncbi:MAG TPA: adenylyltransferase/cytidyltransferase family protein [Victivallales bacterium]|nr:adenylyltransferase/cytidyltransferase family protein [Victivallales bacterium]HPO89865.1 adenylyltransferase/cytidyltransferase family protein [Victivallales bacterium]HRR05831.1 adenylyltransferase/cytidyltransferase family protein [Victivallales bacterium]HRU00379.1 adenylyltransferase/cytidyltransferase family protein [Victivallales bacterium]